MSKEVIVVDGRSIHYEIKDLDIYSIDYYMDNPRINYIISKYPVEQINSELIEKTLLARDATRDLIHDIEANGGLLEPIIVLEGKVIEGNTRLCAYRRLFVKNQDDRWKYIKANVLTDAVTQKEVFTILSSYHINGKTPWVPFEKAACINKMIEQGHSIEEVVRVVGNKKTKVENMLKAYKAMKDNYLVKVDDGRVTGNLEEINKFSYFEALYVNKNLANRANDTPDFLNSFVEWVAEGRIPKAQDVRELHNILDTKKARKKFLESEPDQSFEDAKQVLYHNKPGKVNGFYNKLEQFRELIGESNIVKIREEISSNSNMKSAIKRCFKDFKKFYKEIGLMEDN